MSEPLPAGSADDSSLATPPPAPPAGGRGARVALVLAALAALAALFWPRSAPAPKAAIGGFLVDEDGHTTAVAETLGPQVTLVHLWASWCPPCQAELPRMVAFTRRHATDGVRVVFVAVADEPKVARKFLAAPDIPLRFDPTWDVAHRFGTDKLPETHIVAGGKVVGSFIGPADWDDPAVLAKVQKWIASPTSAKP
jgi:thiol-disulfide isomerase/thioredoxin